MKTLRPFDQTFTRDRIIKARWNGETTTDGWGEQQTEVIEFSVRHSKDHKMLYANLTPLKVGERFERWSTDDAGIRILSKPIARYSDRALKEFYADAYAFLGVISDDPRVVALLDRVNAAEGN